jgi:hypothetical protein
MVEAVDVDILLNSSIDRIAREAPILMAFGGNKSLLLPTFI